MFVDAGHAAGESISAPPSSATPTPILFWFGWLSVNVASAISIGWLLTTMPLAALLLYGPIIAVPQWLLLRAWRIAGQMWLPITIVAPLFGVFVGILAYFGVNYLISSCIGIFGDEDLLWRWFRWSFASGISEFIVCLGIGVTTSATQLLALRIDRNRRRAYGWRAGWLLAGASGGAAVAAALLRLFPRFGSGAVFFATFSGETIAPLLAASSLYAILTGYAFFVLLRRRATP